MENKITELKYVDLFAGVGGIRLGFTQAAQDFGIQTECVFTSEIDDWACKTYRKNFSDDNHDPKSDITKVDEKSLPDFEILLAGFPCQAFSIAGKRGGFNDTRGTLFFDVARIIKEKKPRAFLKDKQPKAFILENVKGLLSIQNGEVFNMIVEKLKDVGYNIYTKILEAKDYGTPQLRKRLFFVGIRKDICANFEFPQPVPLKYSFSDVMGGKTEREYSFTIRIGGRRSGINNRFNWDAYVVDGKVRYITPEECLLLHGFPKSFKLCGNMGQKYHQVGNSVSCCIVNELVKTLQSLNVLK